MKPGFYWVRPTNDKDATPLVAELARSRADYQGLNWIVGGVYGMVALAKLTPLHDEPLSPPEEPKP